MTCERYWREGIVLVERGLDDPHRDGCEDCRRAHASRHELIEALPLIGANETGDPHWQAKVWQRIDGTRERTPWRWRWQFDGVLAVACAIALWIGLGRARPDPDDVRPRFKIIPGDVAMRSSKAVHVGDRLRVTVGPTSDVWIYRAKRLEVACPARQASDRCMPDAHGMVVEMRLSIPDQYVVIVTPAPVGRLPYDKLDDEIAALETANVAYKEHRVPVR